MDPTVRHCLSMSTVHLKPNADFAETWEDLLYFTMSRYGLHPCIRVVEGVGLRLYANYDCVDNFCAQSLFELDMRAFLPEGLFDMFRVPYTGPIVPALDKKWSRIEGL